MSLIPLQVQSCYSFRSSSFDIQSYVKKAKSLGYQDLALADYNGMYGALTFYQACLAEGIRPLVGMTWNFTSQVIQAYQQNLIIFALNEKGYQVLNQLATLIAKEDYEVDQAFDLLKGHAKSLYIIIDDYRHDLHLLVNKDKLDLVDRLFKKYYLQLAEEGNLVLGISEWALDQSQRPLSLKLLAEQYALKQVAMPRLTYLLPTDAKVNQAITAIRLNQRLDIDDLESFGNRPFRNSQAYIEDYNKFSLADSQADLLALNKLALRLNHPDLPSFPLAPGLTSSQALSSLAEEGLALRTSADQSYQERLNYELSIIKAMGFEDYFLIVHDLVAQAKKIGVRTGPGRGSAAGSLVAFVLGITDIDPVKYNLLFERFLNPDRLEMPDIDLDFADNGREKIFRYAQEKYGHNHVANIGTFNTWGMKSTINALSQVLGMSKNQIDQVEKVHRYQKIQSFNQALTHPQVKDLSNQSDTMALFYEIGQKIEGLPANVSIHAAGVVIADRPLTDYTALRSGPHGLKVTQYAMEDVEAIGLVKIDLLAIRTLTQVQDTLDLIKSSSQGEINLDNIPLDDQEVYQLLSQGHTAGVFQFDTPGFRRVLGQVKPENLEQLSAVNALNRPGPQNQIPTYARRKNGQEQISYPHPDLETILDYSFGVMIYQEQVMQTANKVAGYSMAEADLLRSAISKKDKERLDRDRQHFIEGAINRGYQPEVSQKLFQYIEAFGEYGFNHSHSLAYAYLAYQMAYLKTKFPQAFYAAAIRHHPSGKKKQEILVEAKARGITIMAPHVNESQAQISPEGDGLRFGLSDIKGVPLAFAQSVIETRKRQGNFTSFDHFFQRVSKHFANEKALSALVLSGAFDHLEVNRHTLYEEILPKYIDQKKLVATKGLQQDLFTYRIKERAEYSDQVKAEFEEELMDYSFSYRPLDQFIDLYQAGLIIYIADLQEDSQLAVIGIIQSVRVISDKKDRLMAFADIADDTGKVSLITFSDQYEKYGRFLTEGSMLYVQGRTDLGRDGQLQMIVADMTWANENLLSQLLPASQASRLIIELPKTNQLDILQKNILTTLLAYPGRIPVSLINEADGRQADLPERFSVSGEVDLVEKLIKLVGKKHVNFY